ncbi:hypothetical protein IFM89_014176 [Coptis chinensis]|uniref:Flavin-containing monooxygenase n=1 Tax=Coptis chinensis TaxID=261450 RepID=A0A835ICF0_9MAGN|nr:hypothetical protein IFM89_014176 [Coptis chinensis]
MSLRISPSTFSQITMQGQTTPTITSQKVAVIGAGVSGLVAARELHQEGHQVVVFEQNNKIGGTWAYEPNTDSDLLSLDPSRTIVHTSLYESLRTNLPREAMGFRAYPFIAKEEDKLRDPRRFPGHREVLHYLEDFVSEFGLSELIRFETEVVHIEFMEQRKCAVRSRTKDGNVDNEVFNAVVVCNGHHTVPNVAEVPGIDVWPGKQIHSHNYRVPNPFSEKVVVLVGGSYSAFDISREIAGVAKEVHVASRYITNANPTKQLGYDNLWLHSMIESAHEDGTLIFQDESSVVVDVILHCTGYKFDFPFLDRDVVTVDDNRVGLLYQHIFPPKLAPWLSFVGLTWKFATFPLYEVQSKWVAGILSGKISLPTQDEMILDVEAFYLKFEADGVPKRYTHNIWDYQFKYYDWLAAQCRILPIEEWRNQMYAATGMNMNVRPETYRDEWEDQNLILQAHDEFLQYYMLSLDKGNKIKIFSPLC